jgi:AcrR family transcriptional regulator
VLSATLAQLEQDEYKALSMEGIARAASVSKRTLYRWWSSKAEIVAEALVRRASAAAPDEDQGSLYADLQAYLRHTVDSVSGSTGRMMCHLMAEAQHDESFGESFRTQFIVSRRHALLAVFERGRARGEVAADIHLGMLLDLTFGAIWYRLLVRHEPLDGQFADELAAAVVRASAAGANVLGARHRADRLPGRP